MRYYVRQIGMGSVGRFGCLLGWLIALLPSLCIAGLFVVVVQRVHDALARVQPVNVTVLGQQIVHLDFLDLLQLQPLNAGITPWAQAPLMTFVAMTFVLTILGAALWMMMLLLVGLGYNLIARLGFGLELELKS